MKRKPYRLATRATLTADPPFTCELVGRMIEAAKPKGCWISLPEADRKKTVAEWTSILNFRHREFFHAQQERGRKDRRDRVKELVDELRSFVPAIVADAEDQCDRFKGDHLSVKRCERRGG